MIVGLDRFRNHFAGLSDCYVLIGGVASWLVMEEAGDEFRATKDLDIVLCMESLDVRFVEAFWLFVRSGKYGNRQRSSDRNIFYRFDNPADKSFPAMLELFSRNPDGLPVEKDMHLTPIPVGEEVSSLSAILLEEEYYRFIHSHKSEINGIPVVREGCLIPLKARAWLDLSARRERGEQIDSKVVKKHRNDVLRLFGILSPVQAIELPDSIRKDMGRFLEAIEQDASLPLRDLGLGNTNISEIIRTLRSVYGLL